MGGGRLSGGDAGSFAKGHEDRLHADGLIADVRSGAGHGNQQAVHAFGHEDAVGELKRLVLNEDVAFAETGMRGVVFVDAVAIEAELGDGDPVGLAAGQAGGVVEGRVALGEVILAPDAPALAYIDVMRPVAVVGELVLGEAV